MDSGAVGIAAAGEDLLVIDAEELVLGHRSVFSHPFAENRDGKICISCGNVNNAELRVCSFCQSELLSVTCHSPDEDDNPFPNN